MDDQATTIIPTGSLRAALKQGQQLDSTGAQIFLDIFNPAYSESIGADFEFEIDSIIPVSEGAPALIVVRDRSDNHVVCRVPFVYSGKGDESTCFSLRSGFVQQTQLPAHGGGLSRE